MKKKVWDITVKDNPNRVVMGENDEFYTTDTEAYLMFNLQDKFFSPRTATLTLENRNDGSLKSEEIAVVDGVIEWEMPRRYIEHFGNWQGQLVYEDVKDGQPELYTSAPFTFVVNAHIGDKKKPSLVEIENWEKFIRGGTDLIETWEDMEDLRQANEAQRQANYQELLDTGVLQTNINTKLEQLEEEYAPKLTEVTAQLAQTERVKIGGGVKGSLSDFDEETLNFIHDGTGGPIEIGSQPEDYSVGPKQTTFIKVSSNLLNVNDREDGKRTNLSDGSLESHVQFAVSDFIPVKPNKSYTMYGAERYSLYDNSKTHISSEMWIYATETKTITTTENTRFIRISFRQPAHNTQFSEARLNEGGELLPYEPVYKPIFDRDKVEIEFDGGESDAEIAQARIDSKGIVFPTVKSRLDNIENLLTDRMGRVAVEWESGTIGVSGEMPSSTRVRTVDFFESKGSPITVVVNEGYQFNIVSFNESKSRVEEGGWKTGTLEVSTPHPYFKVVLSKVDSSNITVEDARNIAFIEEIELILDNEVTNRKLADRAVAPANTTFVKGEGQYNLFDGNYSNIAIETDGVHRDPRYTFSGFIRPIIGGESYYVKKGGGNRFSVGFHNTELDLTDADQSSKRIKLDHLVNNPTEGEPIVAPNEANYIVVYISNQGEEPELQLTEGADLPFFIGYGIEIDFADKSIKTRALEDGNLFGQLIENYKNQGSSSQSFHFLGDIDTIFKSSENLTQVDLGTSQKVYDNYDLLVSNFPNYVKRNTEGIDSDGRNMYSYDFIAPSIGNQSTNSPNRLKLIFTTGVHGGEKQTVLAAYRFFHELCNNPRNLEELEALKWNIDFKIIPVANPTGYDGLSNNPRNNMDGTNLNRNFPVRWSYFPHGNSDYGGEQPMDAIESQVIDNWLKENLDAFYYIDYHAHPFADPAIYVESDLSATISQSVLRHYERRWKELNDEDEDYSLSAYILNPGRGFIVGHAHDLGLNILLPECPNFGFSSSPLVQQRIVYEYFVNTILTVLKRF